MKQTEAAFLHEGISSNTTLTKKILTSIQSVYLFLLTIDESDKPNESFIFAINDDLPTPFKPHRIVIPGDISTSPVKPLQSFTISLLI